MIAEHTAALVSERRKVMNADPDPALWVDEGNLMRSVRAEVAMARQLSHGGAESQVVFANVLAHLPHTARLLAGGIWLGSPGPSR